MASVPCGCAVPDPAAEAGTALLPAALAQAQADLLRAHAPGWVEQGACCADCAGGRSCARAVAASESPETARALATTYFGAPDLGLPVAVEDLPDLRVPAADEPRATDPDDPWDANGDERVEIFRWEDLGIGYRGMMPFTQAMLRGGMSGWMPGRPGRPHGVEPPPPPSRVAAPERTAAEPDSLHVSRDAAHGRIANVPPADLASEPTPNPAVGEAAPPADPPRGELLEELYRRILARLNADAFEAREWLSGGGAGGTSLPTTTKGDLIVHDGTANVRLPVGADGQVLTARSSASRGVAWEASTGTDPATDPLLLILAGP